MIDHKGKILVIRGGAIGDFILTIPVFQALKKYFPQAELEVLGYPKVARLAVEAGWASQAKSIEDPGLVRFFAPRGPVPPEWQQYFSQFDIIISYLFDPDEIFKKNIEHSGKHHYIHGPHRPDEKLNIHAIDALLKPLEKLAVYESGWVPDLGRLMGTQSKPERKTIRIAMHPGSGSTLKNWPSERWTELIQHFSGVSDLEILVVGGEAERELCALIPTHLPEGKCRVFMNHPLDELARLLGECDAFIGHDSGISHLAAAIGVPSVVLWGPTNLNIWRPVGKHVTVIESDSGLPGITPRQVLREINRLLGKDRPVG